MNLNHIVIGSGPTGLLVHSELKKAGYRGLVLERGKKINSTINDIYTKEQLKNGYLYSGLNILWGNPLTLLSEGSCVGGGSTLNSSLHHRAPNFIWEKWRSKYDLRGFDEERVEKIYSEIENLFDLNLSKSKMNDFFHTAAKFYKVQNIPRWGVEDNDLNLKRTTGITVAKKYAFDIEDDIISNYFIEKISYKSNNDIEITEENQIQTSSADYCRVVKKVKKDNINTENFGQIILCQIPGISSTTALAIMKNYSTFPDFIQKLQENPNCLDDVVYETNGKTRKISKSCIANIKIFLLIGNS